MMSESLSREFRLVTACCRWPSSAARDEAVAAAAAGPMDWALFQAIVERHRVAGLVGPALAAAGVSPPRAVSDHLGRRAREIARQNLLMAGESARLQGLLDKARLPSLLVKGASLAMLAYGSLTHKSAWDIDLLVTPRDVLAAMRVLEDAGYRWIDLEAPTERQRALFVELGKEAMFAHRQSRIVVELHWRLADSQRLLAGLSAASPGQAAALIGALALRTFGTEDLFSYLCVHGASHAWARLKWLADLGALLSGRSGDEIERLYRASLERGAGRCSAQALLLCARLFDTPLPAALERELRSDAATRLLVRLALGVMTWRGGGRELPGGGWIGVQMAFSRYLLSPEPGFALSELARAWECQHDRLHIALPERLGVLYHLIRIPSLAWRKLVAPVALKPRRGYVLVDAVIGLAIIASTLALALGAGSTARHASARALEMRGANVLLRSLIDTSPASEQVHGAGRSAAFDWAVHDQPVPIGPGAARVFCRRTAEARDRESGRLYALSTLRPCGEPKAL